jgi:hypothetical protein
MSSEDLIHPINKQAFNRKALFDYVQLPNVEPTIITKITRLK